MVRLNSTFCGALRPALTVTLADVFANLSDGPLLARLWQYRANARPGYPMRALFRAYVASFVLNLGSTNDLIRRLEQDAGIRRLCGFGKQLPHRTTFNRFIARLSRHPDLVEAAFARITDKLHDLLPDLGVEVAIDSTTVRTHANPHRRHRMTLADPEASWTAKHSAGAKVGGKEWRYGYKLHLVADANHGIPLGMVVTTASRNDSPLLPTIMDKTRTMFPWFKPQAAMADKGYDSMPNHVYLHEGGSIPVIPIRRAPSRRGEKNRLRDGIYTTDGVPTCLGLVPMQYVRTDPKKGHLYRCVGCHLADSRPGTKHCQDTVWENPERNIRLFGVIRREGPEWRGLYTKRQAVERCFKSLKQSRRLERHYTRGLRRVTLHCLVAVLTYQATVLSHIQHGATATVRWMVPMVI